MIGITRSSIGLAAEMLGSYSYNCAFFHKADEEYPFGAAFMPG